MSVFVDAEVVGSQQPRILYLPPYLDIETEMHADLFLRAIDLCGEAGLELDEWQQMCLAVSLAQNAQGKYIAGEVGIDVARQNGKGGFLEARELTGLFLVPQENLIVHSAHEFPTSAEHFRRLQALIEDCPKLSGQVKPRGIKWSHGDEGIELKNRKRIRFRTRTKAGGRGWSGDLMCMDEAMELPEGAFGSLFPSLSARPNPQVVYTGSAVDQTVHADGVVFARVRERALAGDDPSLAWLEWSVEALDDAGNELGPDAVPDEVLGDIQSWATANPGLGIRISPDFVAKEARALAHRTFCVERLGIGDWPPTSMEAALDLSAWAALVDAQSKTANARVFSIDTSPDRMFTSIGVAAKRADGLTHLEIAERDKGTDWVVNRVREINEKWQPQAWILDERGPVGGLLPKLKKPTDEGGAGIEPISVSAGELGQACGLIEDAISAQSIRHLGQPMLTQAIKGAAKRPLGDSWAWSRKSSTVDISPLVAVTLANWALETTLAPAIPSFGAL
jgi:phage terminase large subunit-like protein